MREPVTLFNCNGLGIEHSPLGVSEITLNAHQILKGLHVRDAETSVFRSARISFRGLEAWMHIYGFDIKGESDSQNYEIVYKRPSDLTFELPENTNGALSFWNSRPYFPGPEIKLLQDNYLRLDFEQPQSFEIISKLAWKFQRLLTLLIWQKTTIKWFFMEVDPKVGAQPNLEDEVISNEVQVFHRQASFGSEEDEIHLFPFHSILPSLEIMITRWYQLEEDIRPIIDILYTNIGASNEYVQNNFLNMVQAVEAYHRRRLQDTVGLKKANSAQVMRILNLISDDMDKEWLRPRLDFSYEPSLRNRLKTLFEDHGDVIVVDLKENKKGLGILINFIVEKRNYFTHYDPSLEKKDVDIGKLIQCVDVLKMLLTVLLLKEMGLTEDFIRTSIMQHKKFRFGA
jgi:hypothetical protein